MNALTPNPTTGFLESLSPNLETFDSDKKTKMIAIARVLADSGEYVDPVAMCKAVGIGFRTLSTHLSLDAKFREEMNEARAVEESMLVSRLHGLTKRANGFMPIMARLRDLNGPRWNDQRRVVYEADSATIKGTFQRLNNYIDASIVDK